MKPCIHGNYPKVLSSSEMAADPASAVEVTLHVATTMPATSFDGENNVAQDGDDDDDDIIAKALRYAGVLPPISSMDYPSPVIPPVPPPPACASGNYDDSHACAHQRANQ